MKKTCFRILAGLIVAVAAVAAFGAGADALAEGGPVARALGLPDAATPVAERINEFHNLLLWVIGLITAFVSLLLLYVMVRFRAKTNPNPKRFTHNVTLEVIWTVIPVVILIVIMVPSLKLLYYSDRTHEPDMTLKVTGYQWYWGYEYPDHDGISFMSYMVPDDKIDEAQGQKRLLSTDTVVVLPIDTNIQVLVTAADVLHSFAVPAFGVKIDAVPGRTNETWMRITKPGTYYGQCSELCGKDHAFMPIEIRAVTKEEFEEWLVTAKEQFASLSYEPQYIKLAQAEVTE